MVDLWCFRAPGDGRDEDKQGTCYHAAGVPVGEKPARKWTNVQTSYLGLMIKGCGELNREMREREVGAVWPGWSGRLLRR